MNPPWVCTCSQSWTPSYLPPRTIPLGHPSAPAPSILYPASSLDWWFISYMILYMFQCHSPKSSPTSLLVPFLWVTPCTSPKHPLSCIEPGLMIHFLYDIIHVSMPFSQIIPPSPSPMESKRLFYTSVSLLLSRTQGYCYHLSKFHIYALVYCIGVFFLAYFILYNRLQFHPPH